MIRHIVGGGVKVASEREHKDDIVNMIAIMLDGLALCICCLFEDKRPIMRAWSLFAKNIRVERDKARKNAARTQSRCAGQFAAVETRRRARIRKP